MNYRRRDKTAEIRILRDDPSKLHFWVGRVTPVRADHAAGKGLPALPAPLN